MASDRRIMLSNWRTVILHDDFVIPVRKRKREYRGGERAIEGKKKGGRRGGWNVGRKEGRKGYICETS